MHILALDDNINMHPREIGWGDVNWFNLAQDMDQRRVLVYTKAFFCVKTSRCV
jgi:hypothetical protein